MHRLFIALISLLSTNSFAAEVANLYQSQIPVVSQSEQERAQLAPEVLRQVILKVVGDRAALDIVDLSPVLSQTTRLIQQFQYQRINEVKDDLTRPDRLALALTFNKNALNQLLNNMGLPIWSSSRPDVLLWLAFDDGVERTVLGSESPQQNLVNYIENATEKRGLPILLPLMDLQDQAQVKFDDIWNDFSEIVVLASHRYGTSITLLAKMSVENGSTQISWQTVLNGSAEKWQSRGEIDIAIMAGIEELTDRVARQFTQVVTNLYEQNYDLEISDVRSYADFARVMNYLEKTQYISDVQLTNIAGESLVVNISLKGDIDVFNQSLSIERVLVNDNTFNTDQTLRYRLLP